MKFFVFLVAALASFSVVAASPYKLENIMLLQPDFVLKERMPSIDSFSGYIEAVQAAAESTLSNEEPSPASGFIVLAVRPGAKSNVWLDFKPSLPEETASRLREAIHAVPPLSVKGGTVVFALNATLWDSPPAAGFPNPPEWSKAMEGHNDSIEIGALVDKFVWPIDADVQ